MGLNCSSLRGLSNVLLFGGDLWTTKVCKQNRQYKKHTYISHFFANFFQWTVGYTVYKEYKINWWKSTIGNRKKTLTKPLRATSLKQRQDGEKKEAFHPSLLRSLAGKGLLFYVGLRLHLSRLRNNLPPPPLPPRGGTEQSLSCGSQTGEKPPTWDRPSGYVCTCRSRRRISLTWRYGLAGRSQAQ